MLNYQGLDCFTRLLSFHTSSSFSGFLLEGWIFLVLSRWINGYLHFALRITQACIYSCPIRQASADGNPYILKTYLSSLTACDPFGASLILILEAQCVIGASGPGATWKPTMTERNNCSGMDLQTLYQRDPKYEHLFIEISGNSNSEAPAGELWLRGFGVRTRGW